MTRRTSGQAVCIATSIVFVVVLAACLAVLIPVHLAEVAAAPSIHNWVPPGRPALLPSIGLAAAAASLTFGVSTIVVRKRPQGSATKAFSHRCA